MSILAALLAALILPLALYELVTGRTPGGRQRWGLYRWLTTPPRVRIAALAGLGVSALLLLRYPPETGRDAIAGVIRLCTGCGAALGGRQGKPLDSAPPRG